MLWLFFKNFQLCSLSRCSHSYNAEPTNMRPWGPDERFSNFLDKVHRKIKLSGLLIFYRFPQGESLAAIGEKLEAPTILFWENSLCKRISRSLPEVSENHLHGKYSKTCYLLHLLKFFGTMYAVS